MILGQVQDHTIRQDTPVHLTAHLRDRDLERWKSHPADQLRPGRLAWAMSGRGLDRAARCEKNRDEQNAQVGGAPQPVELQP